MKNIATIICCFLLALFLSCGSKSDPQAAESYFEYLDSINYEKEKAYQLEQARMDSIRNAESMNSTPRVSYSSGRNNTKYDNMRGFDPASEDDMEDNGMSRYMENNDDEGWD